MIPADIVKESTDIILLEKKPDGAGCFCYCLVAQGMKAVYIRRFGQWF